MLISDLAVLLRTKYCPPYIDLKGAIFKLNGIII